MDAAAPPTPPNPPPNNVKSPARSILVVLNPLSVVVETIVNPLTRSSGTDPFVSPIPPTPPPRAAFPNNDPKSPPENFSSGRIASAPASPRSPSVGLLTTPPAWNPGTPSIFARIFTRSLGSCGYGPFPIAGNISGVNIVAPANFDNVVCPPFAASDGSLPLIQLNNSANFIITVADAVKATRDAINAEIPVLAFGGSPRNARPIHIICLETSTIAGIIGRSTISTRYPNDLLIISILFPITLEF